MGGHSVVPPDWWWKIKPTCRMRRSYNNNNTAERLFCYVNPLNCVSIVILSMPRLTYTGMGEGVPIYSLKRQPNTAAATFVKTSHVPSEIARPYYITDRWHICYYYNTIYIISYLIFSFSCDSLFWQTYKQNPFDTVHTFFVARAERSSKYYAFDFFFSIR